MGRATVFPQPSRNTTEGCCSRLRLPASYGGAGATLEGHLVGAGLQGTLHWVSIASNIDGEGQNWCLLLLGHLG